jgi:serine/threonine protein kinase
MELVELGSLREYIDKNGPLNEALCAELGAKVLKVLSYIHKQNVIHKDLKCSNILLTK